MTQTDFSEHSEYYFLNLQANPFGEGNLVLPENQIISFINEYR